VLVTPALDSVLRIIAMGLSDSLWLPLPLDCRLAIY
jgi:hypothetical protein